MKLEYLASTRYTLGDGCDVITYTRVPERLLLGATACARMLQRSHRMDLDTYVYLSAVLRISVGLFCYCMQGQSAVGSFQGQRAQGDTTHPFQSDAANPQPSAGHRLIGMVVG